MQHWLVTYEWRRCTSGSEWRRENKAVAICPGLFWAGYMADVEAVEARVCAKRDADEAAGRPVDRMALLELADYRFLFATPICAPAYEALK